MKQEVFNELVRHTVANCIATMTEKAKEYSTHDDKLHNFRRAGAILGGTPDKAVVAFMTKHLVSILDIVDGNVVATRPLVDEKIGDAINYLILLKASLYERV